MDLNGVNNDNLSVRLPELCENEKNGVTISESDEKLLLNQRTIVANQVLPQFGLAMHDSGLTPRKFTEQMEKATLSRSATLSINSRGREKPDPHDNDDTRTIFQEDRYRILNSNSFKRLAYKTQVFSPQRIPTLSNNHVYTTRMIHTLSVSENGKTFANVLGLNPGLLDAQIFGHDLGIPPFGHAGEQALNEMLPNGFRHNEQSIRIVEFIEGLNLSWETKDGSLNHNTKSQKASTLEGQIVKYSDRIAYIKHDAIDLICAGNIKQTDLPKDYIEILGENINDWDKIMIRDVVTASRDKHDASMSSEMEHCVETLKNFMLEVFNKGFIKQDNEKGKYIIFQLYSYLKKHPNKMPQNMEHLLEFSDLDTVIGDTISYMADYEAIYLYNSIFPSK